jgi:hypothetical protein
VTVTAPVRFEELSGVCNWVDVTVGLFTCRAVKSALTERETLQNIRAPRPSVLCACVRSALAI